MDLNETHQLAQTRSQGRNDEEIRTTSRASSGMQYQVEQGSHSSSAIMFTAEAPLTRPIALKLASAAYAFFVAGVNDGSLGALLPYALRGYRITTGPVAILYCTAFAGWVVAALVGGWARAFVGSGGVLVLGASLQLVAYALRDWVRSPTKHPS
jgi:fucose permease